MGNFGKSFSKQLGRDAGRFVSNKILGSSNISSTRRLIIQDERAERRSERSRISEERSYEKEREREERRERNEENRKLREEENEAKRDAIEARRQASRDAKAQKEAEQELKRWLKEQDRIEKEIEKKEAEEEKQLEIDQNKKEVELFNDFITDLQSIHKKTSYDINWNKFIVKNENFIGLFKAKYTRLISNHNQDYFTREEAIMNLIWKIAKVDKARGAGKFVSNEESEMWSKINTAENFNISIKEMMEWIDSIDDIDDKEIINDVVASLKSQPLFWKLKAIGYMDKIARVSMEDDLTNNMSDKEWALFGEVTELLGLPENFRYLKSKNEFCNTEPEILTKVYWGGLKIDSLTEENLMEKRPIDFDDEFQKNYPIILTKAQEDHYRKIKLKLRLEYRDFKVEDFKITISKLENEIKQFESYTYNSRYDNLEAELKQIEKEEAERSSVLKLFNKSAIEKNQERIKQLKEEIYKIKEQIGKEKTEKVTALKTELEDLNDVKEELEIFLLLKDLSEKDSTKVINSLNLKWKEAYEFVEEANLMHYLALGVIAKDQEVNKAALDIYPVYNVVSDYGSSVNPTFFNDGVEVDFFINVKDVIPTNKKSVTNAGVLSMQPYTNTERNIIIQDYICSLVLRIARETFSLLCFDKVIINAIDNVVNKSTGNNEDVTILSVYIERNQLDQINMDRIDPSDCIENNFEHKMVFDKTKGFSSVANIPNSKLTSTIIEKQNKVEQETVNVKPEKTTEKVETKVISKESAPKGEPIKIKVEPFVVAPSIKIDSSVVKEITISSSMTVSELKEQIKTLFNVAIEVYTTAGNVAGDGRKLRALTDLEIKGKSIFKSEHFDEPFILSINTQTGLTIKLN